MAFWTEIIRTVFTIIAACGAAATAAAAWVALFTWRKDADYRRRLELTQEALAGAVEMQEALAAVRFEFTRANEGKTRSLMPHEGEEQRDEMLDALYVPLERLQQHEELIGKLRVLRHRLRAEFGTEWDDAFDGQLGYVSDLRSRFRKIALLKHHTTTGNVEPADVVPMVEDYQRLMWAGDEGQDPTAERIATPVRRLESLDQRVRQENPVRWLADLFDR
jgi:hypothetical protein